MQGAKIKSEPSKINRKDTNLEMERTRPRFNVLL